jgi:hypothetical protein
MIPGASNMAHEFVNGPCGDDLKSVLFLIFPEVKANF